MNGIYFPGIGLNFNNVPSGFSLFGFEIKFYGLIIASGFILAYLVSVKEAKRTKQDPEIYLDYLQKHGHHSFFTQTWSGNIHMMKVTERLGFTEIVRKTDYREVNGKKYDAVTFRLDL